MTVVLGIWLKNVPTVKLFRILFVLVLTVSMNKYIVFLFQNKFHSKCALIMIE